MNFPLLARKVGATRGAAVGRGQGRQGAPVPWGEEGRGDEDKASDLMMFLRAWEAPESAMLQEASSFGRGGMRGMPELEEPGKGVRKKPQWPHSAPGGAAPSPDGSPHPFPRSDGVSAKENIKT